MKLAMAQMRMGSTIGENLEKSLRCMELSAGRGAELIFFPEVQLSPFFAAEEGGDASSWLLAIDGPEVTAMREKCRELGICASPNIYLEENGKPYDASLMIDRDGTLLGISKMVHIAQAKNFYEQDYYTPSDTGFRVYDTAVGKVGVVICFDRHIPDGIRGCARQGAQLVIVPTANLTEEPMDMFELEIRGQAFQSMSFVAMCNRVGREGELCFAGESLVAAPDGRILFKAGGLEGVYVVDVDLSEAEKARQSRCWLDFELLV